MFNIAIFNSENELNLSDIKNECQNEKWVPIACQETENYKKIILFNDIEFAKNFTKRNLYKPLLIGIIILSDIEVEKIKNQYSVLELEWPKKMKNIKFEIINLTENPALIVHK